MPKVIIGVGSCEYASTVQNNTTFRTKTTGFEAKTYVLLRRRKVDTSNPRAKKPKVTTGCLHIDMSLNHYF